MCASVVGAQASAETPAPPNPLRDLPCVHKPECLPHPCPVPAATGAKAWSPTPGTQLSPPRSVLAWGRAGHGVGSTPLLSGKGPGHCSALCPPTQAGRSGSPWHRDLPPPVLGPGPPRDPAVPGFGLQPPLPRPCPTGSPQPSPAVLQSGLGRPSPRWAGSRGCHVVSLAWGRSRHPQHGSCRGNPVPLPLPSPWQVPPAMSPHRAVGTAANTPANYEFLLLRSLESPHVQHWTSLTHDLDFTALLHTMTQPRASPGRNVARSRTPQLPLPTRLRGGVTVDGFSLIRDRGATRALLGIILGNPASQRGLNISRAIQNKVIRESWVTRAVTQRVCYQQTAHTMSPSWYGKTPVEGSSEGTSLPARGTWLRVPFCPEGEC